MYIDWVLLRPDLHYQFGGSKTMYLSHIFNHPSIAPTCATNAPAWGVHMLWLWCFASRQEFYPLLRSTVLPPMNATHLSEWGHTATVRNACGYAGVV